MTGKDKFRRTEYEYNEMREYLPKEINDVMDKTFNFLKPYITIIKPASGELKDALIVYYKKEFPALNTPGKPYLTESLIDIAGMASNDIVSGVYKETQDIRAGRPYEDFENFQAHLDLFVRPETPKLITVEFYDKFENLSNELKRELVEEHNREEIEFYKEESARKKAFMEVVNPILFKYFEEDFNELDVEGWERVGMAIGFPYHSYRNDCYSLQYYLENGWLDKHPGIDFYHYRVKKNEEREANKNT